MRPLVFAFCLITAAYLPAYPQNPPASRDPSQLDIPVSSDPGKQPFLRQFVHDEGKLWSSPFRKSSYSSETFKKYVLPFTLITGALIATDQYSADLLPNTKDQSTWSLRVSQIGAPYTLAGMAAATYFIGKATGDKKAREAGFLGAVAIGHTYLLTTGIKYATQRERPLDYKEDGHGGTGFFRGGDSFWSGHSSGSFALATVMSYEYGRDHKWVPFVAYGLASTVAASRLSGQKHWMSDIFVGSTVGFLVGRFVYKYHHNPDIDGYSLSKVERFTPDIALNPHGITLAWRY